MNCVICYDKIKGKTSLNCGHSFCLLCIEKWYNNNKNTCPVCRKKFKKNHMYDNIQRVKTRSSTKHSRYKETNKLFNILIDKINNFDYQAQRILINTNDNNINKKINQKFKQEFETCMDTFFKLTYNNRHLYDCKYKSKADNLCLDKKMCDYNMTALKCKNCKFKNSMKKYMNNQLKSYKYKNLSEWEFKLKDVGFF